MASSNIIGWDVGGAHLKAVLLDESGSLLNVVQVPCALWRGLAELNNAVDVVMQNFHHPLSHETNVVHAITMTGELVDLFPSRQAGVQSISAFMQNKLQGEKLYFAAQTSSHFVSFDAVEEHWQQIASANWLASANFVAQQLEHGLFIDIGSTTADFVLLNQYQVDCQSYTDAERMQTEELIYTGVVRTPLMAMAHKVTFRQQATSIAAEYFATMADVYRLTSDLNLADDMAETADGADKTTLASARRLARMIGRDVEEAPLADWIVLANEFKCLQINRLQEVAVRHISRIKQGNLTLVGAGAGSFLVSEIAKRLSMKFINVAELIMPTSQKSKNLAASVCFPAYAVAALAFRRV